MPYVFFPKTPIIFLVTDLDDGAPDEPFSKARTNNDFDPNIKQKGSLINNLLVTLQSSSDHQRYFPVPRLQ